MENSFDSDTQINFEKYLNCPNCKKSGLYCYEHRIEVEQILKQN